MDNPKYAINISYYPNSAIGQTLSNINGVTQSTWLYGGGDYFISSMPEAGISSTGSSYAGALTNLLAIATASTTPAPSNNPSTYKRYF